MATKVPEQSTCWITVSFFGKDGSPATPNSATWQIIDVDSGTEMLAEAAIGGLGSSVELQVPPAANVIQDDTLSEETRRLIIKSTYGASDEYNKSYDYIVENLSVIT